MNNITRQYRYYIALVRKQKLLFFAASLLTMTSITVASYMLPKIYEAQTTIFIEQNVITDLVKGIAITPTMQAKIKHLTATLTSRTLLLKVIKELDKDLSFANDAEQDKYLKTLDKRITIALNEKQGLLVITFRDNNPKFAQDFVNTLARVYIELNTSTKREESIDATNFLAQQIETFKKRIEQADAAINTFKSEKGLILSNDEPILRGEINVAEKKLEDLTIRRSDLEAKLSILMTPRGSSRKGESSAEANLRHLRSIYTDQNPKVQKAMQAVQAARQNKGTGDGGTLTGSDEIKLLQNEIETLKTMEGQQRRIIEENKTMFRQLPQIKADLAELESKKAEEAQIYKQLVTRYGQSEISKQMELADKAVSFRVIDPAITPQAPVSPNRVAIITMGIILGIGVGFAVIILLDRLNPTMRSLDEIRTLGLPVLAIIPAMTNPDEVQAQRRKERMITTGAGFCFTCILIVLALETARAMHLTPWLRQVVGQMF